jgi:hypothetical protein
LNFFFFTKGSNVAIAIEAISALLRVLLIIAVSLTNANIALTMLPRMIAA